MMEFIRKITGVAEKIDGKKDDFSDFFLHAKSKEKTKVLKQIMKEATEEQRNVVEKYKEMAKVV